ncbi:uncharacterized protein N7529_006698 [Penicillium soppii]|jgi:hypothetical protein|uniref:uncharacterized protein n=1 Tax=Penicillium soppii TaxID=69789 RepID=UPI0025472B9E|nr:uncharacterized protein N7529_006698 [Penicillium soppii]KAJ5864782.1 hypothetical protein N7529_006698 [Penicillium soppii]
MEDLPMTDTHPFIHKSNPSVSSGNFGGFAPFGATARSPTEESEQSVNDSGPSTPIHDLESRDNNDEKRIIKPYAVEEPEDEPESYTPSLDVLRLPDRFERWQRDLSDYIKDLKYQADGQKLDSVSIVRKKGLKRKSADTAALGQHCSPPFERNVFSERHQACSQSTKRRRCNIPSQEQSYSGELFDTFREAKGNESSSSETQSTDFSGVNTLDNSPMADEMDID